MTELSSRLVERKVRQISTLKTRQERRTELGLVPSEEENISRETSSPKGASRAATAAGTAKMRESCG